MYRGEALGPFCVSTTINEHGPLIDPASSYVEKWGEGLHSAWAIRWPGGRRALVITVRGSSGHRLMRAWDWRRRRRMRARAARGRHPVAAGHDGCKATAG